MQSFSDAASAQTAVAAADQTHVVGEAAPLWVPDERVTKCQLCHSAFTFTKRRHHCRACGKAVCGDCSRGRAPLKYKNYEVARVCNYCFDDILKSKSILGVSAACRESFRVFTFRSCFITPPASHATYCQGKARNSWIIFRKTSPYKLLRRPV